MCYLWGRRKPQAPKPHARCLPARESFRFLLSSMPHGFASWCLCLFLLQGVEPYCYNFPLQIQTSENMVPVNDAIRTLKMTGFHSYSRTHESEKLKSLESLEPCFFSSRFARSHVCTRWKTRWLPECAFAVGIQTISQSNINIAGAVLISFCILPVTSASSMGCMMARNCDLTRGRINNYADKGWRQKSKRSFCFYLATASTTVHVTKNHAHLLLNPTKTTCPNSWY